MVAVIDFYHADERICGRRVPVGGPGVHDTGPPVHTEPLVAALVIQSGFET
jgi:hypothetical protein